MPHIRKSKCKRTVRTHLLHFNFLLSYCLFAIIIVLFSSCNKTTNPSDKAKKIFKYNESAGISTLDPAFAKDQALIWACNQLYNGLVQLDDDLNIIPCIAKSWQISEDKKTYTFILRDDVYFHNDKCFTKPRKVTANDFVYSFNRILDEKVASPGAWIFEHIKIITDTDLSVFNTNSLIIDTNFSVSDKKSSNNNIKSSNNKTKSLSNDKNSQNDNKISSKGKLKYSFFAKDDTTFVIELKEAFAPFLGLLTMPYAYVVPKEAVEFYGADFRKNPVGTGAFRFKFWKEGVKLVFVKNENYFEKDDNGQSLPYLDAVNISFIVDKQSVFLEFVKGNIDFLSGIDPNYKDEILTRKGTLQPKYKDKINLLTQPYLNTEYLGFYIDNSAANPLNNKLIRQAINYGFDRKKMIKYLRNNVGIAGENGIVPPSLLGVDLQSRGYEYNPQKAKELLIKSGYYKTKSTITLSTTSAYLDLCKYIQQQLGLLGMNVKLETVPPAELRERMAHGKTLWFRGSWIADYPDAENYLSLFYSKNFAPIGPNYTHFSNKKYDFLYEQSIKETTETKRRELYKQMNDIIIDQSPVVVLYYDEVLRFTQKTIHGLSSNAMNLLTLKKVRKD